PAQAGSSLLVGHDGEAKIEQYIITRKLIVFYIIAFNVPMLHIQLVAMRQGARQLLCYFYYFFDGKDRVVRWLQELLQVRTLYISHFYVGKVARFRQSKTHYLHHIRIGVLINFFKLLHFVDEIPVVLIVFTFTVNWCRQ